MGRTARLAKENGKRTKNTPLKLFSASGALFPVLLLPAREASWMRSGGGFASFLICLVSFVIMRESDKGEKPWEMGRSLFLACRVMEAVSASAGADGVGRNHGGPGKGLSLPVPQVPHLKVRVVMIPTLGDSWVPHLEEYSVQPQTGLASC